MDRILTVGIVNHYTRKGEAEFLAQSLRRAGGPDVAVNIAFDDGTVGVWRNYRAALETAGKGWAVVMHDDMTFGRAFFRKAEHILRFVPPRGFVSFYNPQGKAHEEAQAQGYRVLRTKVNFWSQCLAFPEGFKDVYLPWVDANVAPDYPWEDRRLCSFASATDWYCYTVMPSLMQHLGAARSTAGIQETVFGRRRSANNYTPDADVEHVDWEAEFASPYIDNRSLEDDPARADTIRVKARAEEYRRGE